jgi:hypothetical protein
VVAGPEVPACTEMGVVYLEKVSAKNSSSRHPVPFRVLFFSTRPSSSLQSPILEDLRHRLEDLRD